MKKRLRTEALDPNQGHASAFQFLLSSAGDFYFGDGAGGGSVYDASGSYTPGNAGKHYTAATPDGNLLVYDATGQHLYAVNATVVPEAGTLALALPALAMVGAVVIRRRKSA